MANKVAGPWTLYQLLGYKFIKAFLMTAEHVIIFYSHTYAIYHGLALSTTQKVVKTDNILKYQYEMVRLNWFCYQ